MIRLFLRDNCNKEKLLRDLKFGYRADWAPGTRPHPQKHVRNHFKVESAIKKCRSRFLNEIKKGRMLGGLGWSRLVVEKFLRRPFYTIPCGAVPKNDDPHGRIIHNFSFPSPDFGSVNSALQNTTVSYISFKERTKKLDSVDWFLKVDLKDGYRQLPVHPSDWHTQIYSLGANEYYIDLCMPFGKANSSVVFCTWTSAWCEAFKFHFQRITGIKIRLASYVDDFFGGPVRTGNLELDKRNAENLKRSLIEIGELTRTKMNIKKCVGPHRILDILGLTYDSIHRKCYLSASKIHKYSLRLRSLLSFLSATSKDLQKLVGNLVFAAWVIPYGRPFISHISKLINPKRPHLLVAIDNHCITACKVWLILLARHRGLSFDFILGRLPYHRNEWFVDASSSFGYGGICGSRFFMIAHPEVNAFLLSMQEPLRKPLFIAYEELLAVLLAFVQFAALAPGSFIRINSDNDSVVSWVNSGRCSRKWGFIFLAAVEFFKAKYQLKVKAFHIPSSHNSSADSLSRGRTPRWLKERGSRKPVNIRFLFELINYPEKFWRKL